LRDFCQDAFMGIASGGNLDYHAEKLLAKLLAGRPLRIALNELQEGSAGHRVLPMNYATHASCKLFTPLNDPYARLVYVYLSESEWGSMSDSQRYQWYYKLP
jgi:hypothetical protein